MPINTLYYCDVCGRKLDQWHDLFLEVITQTANDHWQEYHEIGEVDRYVYCQGCIKYFYQAINVIPKLREMEASNGKQAEHGGD